MCYIVIHAIYTMTQIVVNSHIFAALELYTVLIDAIDIIARQKGPLDIYNTILMVTKQCIFIVLKVFMALIAAYYIVENPERLPGNYYYYNTYLARGVIYIYAIFFSRPETNYFVLCTRPVRIPP